MQNRVLVAAALSLLLAACGGGGGGVDTNPPPPPPPPTNTTITDLKASQTFDNDATGMKLVLDRTTSTGISGEIRPNAMTVRYDVATQSYSVSADGRSETFAPADLTTNAEGEPIYQKANGDDRNYLTIVTTPYTSSTSNQYVGLAYWQHNVLSGTRQDTDFYIAAYGLPTAAAAVPRTGTAGFRTDAFGLASAPGEEPRSFQGEGEFSVDFAAGVFAIHNYLTETTIVSGDGVSGGGIEFTGAGHLSSSGGGFSGNALYEGWFGAAAGPLNGRFYGPGGEELGGAFSGSNGDGMTVVGGFTGRRDPNVQVQNLTLTNLTRTERFAARLTDNRVGHLEWLNPETFNYGPPSSGEYGGLFTIADKVASSDPNFTEYHKTFGSGDDAQDVVLRLYKPGNGNSELALTYASFVHYTTDKMFATGGERVEQYAGYGLETPDGLLLGKTGTASYSGILYGKGWQSSMDVPDPSNVTYDVKGSSQFTVDFGAQRYTGALAMAGPASDGSGVIDFGSYDVAGRLTITGVTGAITRDGVEVGQFAPYFYGPDGEEIVAPFSVFVQPGDPGYGFRIDGIAAAKRE